MVQNKNLETFIKKLSNSPKNEYDGNSFVLELANTELTENVERIESLNAGDALRLNLVRVNEKNVCQICDVNNQEIGILATYAEMITSLITAKIISIGSVVANSVIPVSQRKKGSKKALVSVKITFKENVEADIQKVEELASLETDTVKFESTAKDMDEDVSSIANFESIVEVEPLVENVRDYEIEDSSVVSMQLEASNVVETTIEPDVTSASEDANFISLYEVVEPLAMSSYEAFEPMQCVEVKPNFSLDNVVTYAPEEVSMNEKTLEAVTSNDEIYQTNAVVSVNDELKQEEILGEKSDTKANLEFAAFENSNDNIKEVVEFEALEEEPQEVVEFEALEEESQEVVEFETIEEDIQKSVEDVDTTVEDANSAFSYNSVKMERVVEQNDNSDQEFAPFYDASQVVYMNTFNNSIEMVRNEVDFIIDQCIDEINQAQSNGQVISAPFNRALTQAMNVLKLNKIDDEEFLVRTLGRFMQQVENMYMSIEMANNKAIEYVNSLVYIEFGTGNTLFNTKYNAAVSLIQAGDTNILQLSEVIEKIWNTIPKKKRMEELVERCIKVADKLLNISKQVITVTDIYHMNHGTLKYVSSGMVEESHYKWQSAYEYLPFVKERKYKHFLNELGELQQGFERTKAYYGTVRKEKEDLLRSILEERTECEEQLNSLGIFAFNTKKFCRERLIELEKEEKFARDELESIEAEYGKLVEDMAKKIENCKSKVAWYAT